LIELQQIITNKIVEMLKKKSCVKKYPCSMGNVDVVVDVG